MTRLPNLNNVAGDCAPALLEPSELSEQATTTTDSTRRNAPASIAGLVGPLTTVSVASSEGIGGLAKKSFTYGASASPRNASN